RWGHEMLVLHPLPARSTGQGGEKGPDARRRPTAAGERLCLLSSGLPWAPVTHDRIEDDQELAHGGHESHLGGAAGGNEPLVNGRHGWVAPARRDSGHVEDGANTGPAAADHAASSKRPAVTVQRSHPHQRRNPT